MVTPKKNLGQHFLVDKSIAERIALSLSGDIVNRILEIGPGTGALTKHLLENYNRVETSEIDNESIAYLATHFPQLKVNNESFLNINFGEKYPSEEVIVIGNFPYNISSQIVFKIIDNRSQIPQMVGMFQKEVAERIVSAPGNKSYGILSVLTQLYYDVEYLFTVEREAFNPPPKVRSGVIRIIRKKDFHPPCDEQLFKKIVKATFNHRRKTIRNTIKPFLDNKNLHHEYLSMRPEQLSSNQFIELTNWIVSIRNERT